VHQVSLNQVSQRLSRMTSNLPRRVNPSGRLVSGPSFLYRRPLEFPFLQGQARFLHGTCHPFDRRICRPITGTRSRYTFHLNGKTTNASNVCPSISCTLHCMLLKLPVEFDPGCEAMIYTTDGTPLQGLWFLPLTRDLRTETV
jgi:hypothetical protein